MKKYIGLALASFSIGCNYFGDTQFKQVSVDLGALGEMNNIVEYKDGRGFYLCREEDELLVTPLPAEFLKEGGDVEEKRRIFYEITLCEKEKLVSHD